MRTPSNQLFADIDFLVDELGMNANECDDVLHACDELGGISAEYFCEEFIFETGDPDDIDRLHDPNYLKINWGLN
ncbi:hypothetical protein PSSM2_087 [Prochlorococcus phage P-SSM2]|jgi:hypothetical protein|uniref:Uncharacterized protein n=2 Tax=Salacisavirus pssm2 TaxID=2734140 RepID=Q58MR7_BPPRM|nr:hypothetical protein PSSM2_087 [Prochlorococcus phage P-SSM2]AAX44465.1 hypothetical protein PSSM2_087 [Prochlorococcus phage P-SSM2]ACY75962.1 conserved hypothetical protein [Prochlorococcus phage P-SSM2]AGN12188.1 hypothetical protein PRTG_00030 [Prochlorococcus phage P-SSM5]